VSETLRENPNDRDHFVRVEAEVDESLTAYDGFSVCP